ncbi:unnamed protein product [Plutella xylostella]|uniref:(diamondback moth) hypothetical protein n=1 Tax=Plutella xylostella TaxID=51655 RepID=A0A8S4E554_PLUXY|nr:unnamed protein product [Plutella xylostella]
MSTERRLSRSFHSCLKGSSTEEAPDDEDSCYHSLGGRHSLSRHHPPVYVEDLSTVSLADFETTQEQQNAAENGRPLLAEQYHKNLFSGFMTGNQTAHNSEPPVS